MPEQICSNQESSSKIVENEVPSTSKKQDGMSQSKTTESVLTLDKNMVNVKKMNDARNTKKKEKKELIQVKKRLKETERKLAESLKNVEAYRHLVIKKQKEIERWQDLNAQMQTKVYEKLNEFGKYFKFDVNITLSCFNFYIFV